MSAVSEPRRRSTATSPFGVGRREGHDSSAFHERFTPPVPGFWAEADLERLD